MPTISVIVPVYNAEKYIEECVSSIINQSFSDFELLLIDDGSTDSSGALCDSFAEKDSRIKVFHKKNEGVSSARNFGIEKSVGKWIVFIDSDDYVDKDYLKSLYVQSQNCDIVSCGFYIVDEKGSVIRKILEPIGTFYSSDIDRYVNNAWFSPAPWGHLILAKLVKDNNIFFPKNRSMGEDAVFILQCIALASCLRNISTRLYFYRTTPNSLLHPTEDKISRFIEDFRWTNNQIKEIGKGRFSFYYKMRQHALMLSLKKYDSNIIENVLHESQVTVKGELFYWLKMPLKTKILMLYIFFPKPMQLFVMNLLFKVFLKE